MTSCRYDKDTKDYLLPDGEPCKVDDYGDPTTHCKSQRTCSQHVGRDELTCPRCIARVRGNLRKVTSLSALMLAEAIDVGVESAAANLAGPGGDYAIFSARRMIAKRWIFEHLPEAKWEQAMTNLLDDDDDRHPYSVLTRWQMMLSEDWGHDLPAKLSITGAAAYLERNLARLANDPEQDWPLFAAEVRKVHSHMEAVLHNDTRPERGAPCPDCRADGHVVRLHRVYGHWCEGPDCMRFHHADTSDDRWVCSRNRDHVWTHAAYSNYLEERGA
jgi:hypothetical protein